MFYKAGIIASNGKSKDYRKRVKNDFKYFRMILCQIHVLEMKLEKPGIIDFSNWESQELKEPPENLLIFMKNIGFHEDCWGIRYWIFHSKIDGKWIWIEIFMDNLISMSITWKTWMISDFDWHFRIFDDF
ncbi:unnamed protein product [Caenorhabditis angaria]|uniref:Uncharacterized protein n=1 Tax=Caenorhabditis angaria TaxID=860376 RepID=A0A9P1MVG6_9PELO|nr:unnamed protein product [Caenorhabditis angaria]